MSDTRINRDAAEHFCPCNPKARTHHQQPAFRSAVSSTIIRPLPPISMKARLSHFWPGADLGRPFGDPQVAILRTREVDEPRHRVIDEIVANATTGAGNVDHPGAVPPPPPSPSSASMIGLFEAGFTTIVFPASTGPIAMPMRIAESSTAESRHRRRSESDATRSLARHLHDVEGLGELDRLTRVVLDEIDGLGDVSLSSSQFLPASRSRWRRVRACCDA